MIPYFTSTSIPLGPITIQTWGLFIAFGFIVGATASAWLAKRRGLKATIVWDLLGWLLFSSLIFARLFFVVFYLPSYFIEHPLEVFAIWQGGMSMMGGLFGATLVGVLFLSKKKLAFWQYLDVLIFGLPLGYFIGRIGCFLIHDHPGLPTSFFLGVQYPDSFVRHDLGLYHSLFGLILFVIFLLIRKMKLSSGSFVIIFLCSYGLFRFLFDFLRISEQHWWFLTPGQWFGLLMIVGGAVILFRKKLWKKN